MQEWIIAMLVVSVILIIRDMAKTFFEGKSGDTQEVLLLTENHPQKKRVQQYAQYP